MNERKTNFGKLLKRVLIVALCLVMALGTTVTIMAASFNGDLDGDGKITAYDAQLLAEYQAGDRDLDPATVIGLTIRDILDRVLGKIVDEPVEEPSESTAIEETFTVEIDENNLVAEEQVITVDNVTVTVPVGVKVDSAELILTVQQKDTEDGSVNLEEGQEQLPLDIHIEGISEENTVPVIIYMAQAMEAGLNQGNLALYHVENGEAVAMTQVMTAEELTAHNQFYYDPATGDVTIATVSFSIYRMVYVPAAPWEGEVDHSWYDPNATELYIANADQLWSFSQIVGGMTQDAEGNWLDADGDVIPNKSADPHQDSFAGKTVKLIADINLNDLVDENDKVFYPIGYYSSDGSYDRTGTAVTTGFYTFQGTFDGQGHTISNFYQNTWEMKGDNNYYDASLQYYRDGMGLFGKIYGGTVKNLTVENFSNDGEYTTTGTIAAYADGATFENIAIFNCNPRVYNIGNGGIVGCVGWYAKDAGLKTTFKNITVDNSNKISALWGSWDVACGGILGQYYPTSGQSSANYPVNAGVHFENCHAAAQIDVYNDVCANYQYYAYRYAGMLIGSVRENVTIDGREYPKMDGITAENCTVHFGDWNDYYYCELVANTLASYTHDHQMSRLEQVAAVNGNQVTYLDGTTATVTGTANFVVVKEKDNNGLWLHGDGHDYAECYHFVNGEVWNHEDAGEETVNGETVLKEDKQCIYRVFEQLCTGYGWGVTSKGVEDLDGVTVLDRATADSVVKFQSKNVSAVDHGITLTLGELFEATENGLNAKTQINPASLQVAVTDVDNDARSIVSASFNRNITDWTQSTLTFSGMGEVQVTIQDYYFCAPTTIDLTVNAHVHCLCGAETNLGDTCASCDSEAVIWDPNTGVDLPDNSAEGYYYLTEDISRPEGGKQYVNDIAFCLNGKTVTSQSRCLEAECGATVSITDCDTSDEMGVLTGSTHAALLVEAGGTLNLYNGTLTGNHNQTGAGSGIVNLGVGTEGTVAATFNMYGGKITDNITNMRGAVFTQVPKDNTPIVGIIRILGGEISNNISHALNDIQDKETSEYLPNSGKAGGAGIYSFGPVTIGGSAKIYNNTCTYEYSTKNDNVYLRTSGDNALYSGQLILDSSLTKDACIDYGTYPVEAAENMKFISGTWVDGVVTYDGDPVLNDGNRFYTEHVHCLCGQVKTAGAYCNNCGSEAFAWTAVYRLPHNNTEDGHYYLRTDINKTHYANMHGNVDVCLNGHTVNSKGNACLYAYDDATVSIADCEGTGKITGTTERATIVVAAGGTLKLYGGNITGNRNDVFDSGIISLLSGVKSGDEAGGPDEGGSDVETPEEGVDGQNTTVEDTTTENTLAEDTIVEEARPGGKFYMYGGKISGNTAKRGAVFTHEPASGTELAQIHILGGEITGNIGTHSANEQRKGGAGIYSFGPVYVGGDAKIYGNICPDGVTNNHDIFLRNAATYGGKLIVSADKPLVSGANINYGTNIAEPDLLKMQYISGNQEKWDPSWIKCDGKQVGQANGTFYIEGATYCMCGETTEGTCAYCNTAALEWTAWDKTDSVPSGGNYFLTADVYPTALTTVNADTAINLNGYDIIAKGEIRFVRVSKGTLSITDTSAEVGEIRGFVNDGSNSPIIIANGATLDLYNGKITDNAFEKNAETMSHKGVIQVAVGATFNMYGGEISGNTTTRGTIYGDYVTGNAEISAINILGGTITNNIATALPADSGLAGGAGIYSFGPVTVGGTAQIYGNLYAADAYTGNNADIYLRNQENFAGKLIIASEKQLLVGARVNYGTAVAETAGVAMSSIDFSGTAYALNGQVTYNEQAVSYTDGVFTFGTNDGGEGSSEAEPAA